MINANFFHGEHICQQVGKVISTMPPIVKEIKPKKILEIGTGYGGFTKLLFECSSGAEIISVDIEEKWRERSIYRNSGVSDFCNFHKQNIFDLNFLENVIKPFLNNDGKNMIFCDGANKIQEFEILSEYLKSGDYILAHDYCENMEAFESNYKGKIWDWCEITDDDIELACQQNNLVSYKKEELSQVMWVCKQKN